MAMKSELFNKTKKYLSYRGTSSRLEYFVCVATATFIILLAADSVTSNSLNVYSSDAIGGMMRGVGRVINFPLVAVPFYLISIVLLVTAVIRRLRHLSMSLWWTLMLLVTLLLNVVPYWTYLFIIVLGLISNEDEPIFSAIKNKAISSGLKPSSSTKNISKPEENVTSNVNINVKDILQAVNSYFLKIFLHSKYRNIYISVVALLVWFFVVNVNGTMDLYQEWSWEFVYGGASVIDIFTDLGFRHSISSVPIIIIFMVYIRDFIRVSKDEILIIKSHEDGVFKKLVPVIISAFLATLLVLLTYDDRWGFVWLNGGIFDIIKYTAPQYIGPYLLSTVIMWAGITFGLPSRLRRLLAKSHDKTSS